MAFIPSPFEIEVDRVLMSLSFDEFKINMRFIGTPSKWLEKLKDRKNQIKDEIKSIKEQLLDIKNDNLKNVERYYSRLMMEFKIEELKSFIACTDEFFYLTGWIPSFRKKNLLKSLEAEHKNLIIVF